MILFIRNYKQNYDFYFIDIKSEKTFVENSLTYFGQFMILKESYATSVPFPKFDTSCIRMVFQVFSLIWFIVPYEYKLMLNKLCNQIKSSDVT